MIQKLSQFLMDDRGATAIEYGLIAALIVLGMMVGLTTFADTAINMWNDVSTNVQSNA